MPKVAFIGAGKVGCSMARWLAEAGVTVTGFSSRSAEHAREAAEFAGGIAFTSAAEAAASADVVFVTTPDGAIANAWHEVADAARSGELDVCGKVVCHCSGALASSAFDGADELGAHAVSAHPLYAVSSRFDTWREFSRAHFTVEGDEAGANALERLLRDVCGVAVTRIAAADKPRYHAAAVMASNLVVGLFAEAAHELEPCGFAPADAEAALVPLFLGNAQHVAEAGPVAALTGPAARGDEATIARHLAVLTGRDRDVYRLLTEELRDLATRR